jgi:acetate---CoA ligase (ADP-forming)
VDVTDPVAVMLEARSVALVGASPRAGSLGARMVEEVAKSPGRPRTYLVNPRYDEIGGERCYPGLADLPEPVDLALLAVPDIALEEQVRAAGEGGVRSAVIFGSAVDPAAGHPGGGSSGLGLRGRIAAAARDAGMAVCGAGCMGFVNVARGLRAIGYTEADPLPAGPVALVTHSGSVFSALLRTRRAFGFTLAVSSGQELVTPAAAYARYALSLPETKALALVLETIRDAPALRSVLGDAAARDVPVFLLAAGTSAASRSLVAAHSGALAAGDGAWQALASAYGVHRVGDLAELADTLELLTLARRPGRRGGASDPRAGSAGDPRAGSGASPGGDGLATVHDSGFERAHVADLAAELGVPFAPLTAETIGRLGAVLDPGLEPGNPLDVWGTGRDPEALFTESLLALAGDPGVGAVALAVDLVPEYDGDDSYRTALLAAASKTSKPVAVLASIPAAIDQEAAAMLRAHGIPVLESTRTGLLALRHLLSRAALPAPELPPRGHTPLPLPPEPAPASLTPALPPCSAAAERRARWSAALTAGPLPAASLFDLLRDYGIPAVAARSAGTVNEALAAAAEIGYPVALKTDAPGIAHKSDVDGVRLGIADPAGLAVAYAGLSARLGPTVTVTEMACPGPELILGMARDPALGPLIVIGAGGILAEYLSDRVVALPPLTGPAAAALIIRQRFARLLTGFRGQPATDLAALAATVAAFSDLVTDLAGQLAAFDINPLICTPAGPVAVDVLTVPVAGSGEGGDQQDEGGDDDGDADVVKAVPAVHLLLPVLGPVLGGPRLAPVVDRDKQQKRHDHAEDQQRAGGDDEAGAVVVPSGDGPDHDEDERGDVPDRHHGAEHPAPVGAAELATVTGECVEDPVEDKGDGELHPHHQADGHGGGDLKCVEHDDPP